MPYKYTADGQIETHDVNGVKLPVFVAADGKATPFDADSTIGTISRLNGEAKAHRERAEKAEGALKAFDGISDAEAARKALATVANLDAKKLVDAGEVEKVKAAAVESVRAQFEPVVKKAADLEAMLYAEKIGGAFARSRYIAEKIAVPPDMLQAAFGRHFAIDGGRIVAKDANGTPLFSRQRHGEPADFEEAIEVLVESYQHKASILKGANASGGGAQHTNGTAGGARKTMPKAEFDKLAPKDRAQRISEGYSLTE